MSKLTLDVSRRIVAAGMDIAAQRAVGRATMVVTDPAGVIYCLERNDASGAYGVDFALAKARTALGMQRSTMDLADAFIDRPGIVASLAGAVGGNFLPMGGGVVIVDGAGMTLGAVAFSGAPHEIDHEIAVAAVKASGLSILESR